MPIYELICDTCGKEDERILPHDAVAECPHCGVSMRRKLSGFSVRGSFRHMDWGKSDRVVSYPDGRTKHKPYNERIRDGTGI